MHKIQDLLLNEAQVLFVVETLNYKHKLWKTTEDLPGYRYVEDITLGIQIMENTSDFSVKITTW